MRNCPTCGANYADDLSYCPNDGTATLALATASNGDDLVGTTIDGRYRIEARIGEGGMGVVYRASHVVLKKALAIKVMRGDQAHDAEVVQRFVQEARSSSAIGHPNIIGISDFGTTHDGSVYFAMEYLEGETLGKAMEHGPIERERAIDLFMQITSALEAAHQRGIVHRDLKPDNIFLATRGGQSDIVKVLDFGIAKVKNAAAKITRTGMVFGTPHYMSPEQAAGQAVDQRSDIYSLGVIMFQVFAGQLPFDAESYMGVMTKHMFDPPPLPSSVKPGLRGSIEDVILMALAKKPEQRYQSMLAIKEDLERLRRGERVSASDVTPIGSSATLPFVAVSDQPKPAPGGPEPVAGTPRDTAESFEIPVRKRPVWLWPAVLGGLVAVVAFLFAGRDGDDAASPPSAASARPAPAPAATAAAPADPRLELAPKLAPKQLRVTATPALAQIEVDGVAVGQGEAELVRPSEGRQHIVVSAPGYLAQTLLLDAQTPDVLHVELVAAPVRTAAPASTKPRSKPAPTAAPQVAPEPPPRAGPKRRGGLNDVVDPWQ